MSFRSAWRHAAKSPTSSPTTPHIAPKSDSTVTSTIDGVLEPTLVVRSSRPPSIRDVSQLQTAMKANTTENGVETREEQVGNGEGNEDGKKELTPQDAGWFAWWGNAKSESSGPSKAPETKATENKEPESKPINNDERPRSAPASTTTVETTKNPVAPVVEESSQLPKPSKPVSIAHPPQTSETASGSYLTWIWSSRSPPKSSNTEPERAVSEVTTANGDVIKPSEPESMPKPSGRPSSIQNPLITTLPQTRSSWMSFWARTESMSDLKRKNGPETMEIPAEVDPQGRPLERQKAQDNSPLNITTVEANPSIKSTAKPIHTPTPSLSSIPITPTKPISSPKPETPSKKDKNGKDKIKSPPPPNHVLPTFESVYPIPPAKESIFTRVTRAILPASNSISPGALHSHPRRTTPPLIKKAVAIGIHGFFPLRILRSVLGEPTGTSVKFATLASEAIHRFSSKQYGSPSEIEVVKIALEGEGTVSTRIEMLWKNLSGRKEWMDHIREADLILVACHSQGSPVGAGIIARLVEQGIVAMEKTKLGLLCVAGIHLGPATDVGQRVVIKAYNAIESEAARELYEFQDSDSKVSRKYVEALRTILAADTRVTLIGSIDDHLVPMYSSTFSTAYHGSIYRAVFIDGRIHQTDFLARLVAFALRLRNEGWRDHGVMSELSSALMGNFYTGEGHSRIYDEPAVYDLALRNTLETSSMKSMPLHIEPFKARTTPNPYLLPWSMRGVLEETIRGPLSHELDLLKEEFAQWDPKGPKLKDLKWRMEGWSTSKPRI